MATINYVTIEFNESIQQYAELIQSLPYFNVYKNKHQKGVIFRIPRGLQLGDLCHVFIEHEVNLTNTLKTGTLTMKVQLTFLPVHIGVFSGFAELKGSYHTNYFDEDDYSYGDEYFVPDYNHSDNVKKVVPLPVNMQSNLYEYLNEIIFQKIDDMDLINKYAVALGCQKDKLQKSIKFIPAPKNTGSSSNAIKAHKQAVYFFESVSKKNIALIPENVSQTRLFE